MELEKERIEPLQQKMEDAVEAIEEDDQKLAKTKLREVYVNLETEVRMSEGERFSEILKDKMQDRKETVIEALEDRAEKLEAKKEVIEDGDYHTEDIETTKFSPIHSDESLKALKYEISRLKNLDERGRL